ncbi:GNAT family N-acetyltransferase [Aeoliella sp. ICT_H6.2]|uniref:GNAT family N-acetyltransferase n=1 Tax=Aeoliella straminimaris TaxID=2954799 RepID=A0A9X2JJI8_9BACT|nr:GNAT family N-acetyltransferase [Aeoliella straminimaris]MCO6046783.1 GNAT family N-acetyltransferase [Aeoliella straminimaris]
MNAHPTLEIRLVDKENPADIEVLVAMIDAYAQDVMGGAEPLDERVRAELPQRFSLHPATLGWLAWLGDEPVGAVAGVLMFGTFAARSRVNIHDLSVVAGHRDQGIGRKLLAAVEDYARRNDCHALTLEVRADNDRGRHLYWSFGFRGPTEWSPPESMAFWKKELA